MTDWITAYFAEAGRIARLPPTSAAFASGWNATQRPLARSPRRYRRFLMSSYQKQQRCLQRR